MLPFYPDQSQRVHMSHKPKINQERQDLSDVLIRENTVCLPTSCLTLIGQVVGRTEFSDFYRILCFLHFRFGLLGLIFVVLVVLPPIVLVVVDYVVPAVIDPVSFTSVSHHHRIMYRQTCLKQSPFVR